MYANNSEYLCHYGIVGMKWGQRRLQKRIANAKAIGNTDKVKKLKERYDQNESMKNMKTSDKLFLSREGVLANQRLLAKGQSKLSRMMTLHGMNILASTLTDMIAGPASAPFKKGIMEGKNVVANSLGSISVGAISIVLGGKARDYAYKQLS